VQKASCFSVLLVCVLCFAPASASRMSSHMCLTRALSLRVSTQYEACSLSLFGISSWTVFLGWLQSKVVKVLVTPGRSGGLHVLKRDCALGFLLQMRPLRLRLAWTWVTPFCLSAVRQEMYNCGGEIKGRRLFLDPLREKRWKSRVVEVTSRRLMTITCSSSSKVGALAPLKCH
jgi:hypothetical protein